MNMILILILVLVLLIPLWVLFSSGSESDKVLDENNRPLRRRAADRMIEEEETSASSPQQKKADESRSAAPASDELVDVEDDFNLPFHPAEIIPVDSPFEIYRRTIANAETYMKRGDFVTARSLYEGVLDRISDNSVRQKLEDNLEYLNNYHQVVARRTELRRQKKDLKPQEIRLTLEGADNLADRIQIGIAPEKNPVDLNEIVDKLSEKLTGLAPEVAKKANQTIDKYRDELSQLRNQLHDITSLKDQVRKLNEDQIIRDKEEIERLKRELTDIHEKTKDIPTRQDRSDKTEDSHALSTEKEKQIIEEIERREEENRLLRDRLDLVQKELSMLQEDSRKSAALEQALASTLVKKDLSIPGNEPKSPDLSSYEKEIESLKQEIASIRDSHNESNKMDIPVQSMGELAGALKESMDSLTPLISDSLKNRPVPVEDKKNESGNDKKDDFQLLEEMINGPKFEEPTEEEVLAKILNDAVKEHSKQTRKDKKEDIADPKKSPETSGKDNLKEDFELVSDYMKSDDGNVPTDEAVMEKILRDAMKSKEFRNNTEQQENDAQKLPRGFQPPSRKRKELPILRVSYNFSRLPDEFTLSIDKNHLEYSFYKFKPLLEKASELVKRRKVKDAINYYKVVMDQDIPQEFKDMLSQNIHDLNEYLTKYYTSE